MSENPKETTVIITVNIAEIQEAFEKVSASIRELRVKEIIDRVSKEVIKILTKNK